MSLLTGKSGIFFGKKPSNIFITRAIQSILYDDEYFALSGKDIFAGIGSFGFDEIYEAMTGNAIYAGMDDPAAINDLYTALSGKSIFAGMDDPAAFNDVYTAATGKSIFAGMSDDALYEDIYTAMRGKSIYAGMEDTSLIDDTYIASTGNAIYAGIQEPINGDMPSWIVNQPINTWGVIPTQFKISQLDPKNDPNVNSNYPNVAYWSGDSGQPAIISAWNGAWYNYDDEELVIGFSGGHVDYGGNEHYVLNVFTENPTWIRATNPSGGITLEYPTGFVTDVKAEEATGLFKDGRPRTSHSYNKLEYVPNVGLVVANQSGVYKSAGAGTNKQIIYDKDTHEVTYFDGNFIGSGSGSSGLGCTYDPTRHCLWVKPVGSSKMFKWDLTTKVWSSFGSILNDSSSVGLVYLPEVDCVFVSRDSDLYVWSCTLGTWKNIPTTDISDIVFMGRTQPRYLGNKTIAMWNNPVNTTKITVLKYPLNPMNDDWEISSLPVASSNSVIPTAATENGTYGRFFHSSRLGILGVINGVSENTYFYKYKEPEAVSVLEEFINSMASKEWRQFNDSNIVEFENSRFDGASIAIMETTSNAPWSNWANKFCWDELNKEIHGVGVAQGYSIPGGEKYAKQTKYSLKTNKFTVLWNPTGQVEAHVYDGNCSNLVNGKTWRKALNRPNISEYNRATDKWGLKHTVTGLVPAPNGMWSIECSSEHNGLYGIEETSGRLVRWDLTTDVRTVVSNSNSGIGAYPLIVKVNNNIIFGGGVGGSKFYKVNVNNNITVLYENLPTEYSAKGFQKVLAYPDGSDNLILISKLDMSIRKLNTISGELSEISSLPSYVTLDYCACASLIGLNAIVFWWGRGRDSGNSLSQFWVYKI